MFRRRWLAGFIAVVLGLGLAGCSASPSDIRPIAAQALAATRSAETGLRLLDGGATFSTTDDALLGDMVTQLGDVMRQLETTQTSGASAERMRVQVLGASRAAVDAIHDAQQNRREEARRELRSASAELARLAGGR